MFVCECECVYECHCHGRVYCYVCIVSDKSGQLQNVQNENTPKMQTMAGGTDRITQECKHMPQKRAKRVFLHVFAFLGFAIHPPQPLFCIFGVRFFALWSFCSWPDLFGTMNLSTIEQRRFGMVELG